MKKSFILGAAMAAMFTTNVSAEEHVIKAAVTKFDPMVVFAQPGDTIIFQNMAGHDAATMDGMIPEGAEKWQSKMGELFSVTLDKEGLYLYKCTPHASLGMMGGIVVGNSDNLDTLKEAAKTTTEPKGMLNRTIRKVEQAIDKKK